ncbi:MAG: histidinol-phosphate transaminase [Methanocellales archaeon]|nr:histidinol-phosphate transaminase [Methanocellales archaeon]
MVRIRKSIEDVQEYIPGKTIEEVAKRYGVRPENVIKLASNENPLGPSPKVVKAIKENATLANRYPPADAGELREALSKYVGFPPDQIVAGAGADGVMDVVTRLFIEKGHEVLIPIPTFPYYEIFARACGGTLRFISRDENFDVSADDVLSATTKKTKMVIICSPNNPTGNQMSVSELKKILDEVNVAVMVDEAYVEFADFSVTPLVREYENLIVVRTMSKAFGLAGLRIGYGILPAKIAREYMKIAPAFSVNKLGIAAGIAALGDKKHLHKTQEIVKKGRAFLQNNIPFKTYPSQANFVLMDVSPLTAEEVCEALMKKGIIVRDCSSFRGAGNSLIRVSVGTSDENQCVVGALREVSS